VPTKPARWSGSGRPSLFLSKALASVYSTMSATQLSHPFDSFESQRKSSIPAFLRMRMADLVPAN